MSKTRFAEALIRVITKPKNKTMPRTISDSSGNDIEVFSKEELDQQIEAVVEEYTKQHPDNTQTVEDLRAQVAKYEKDLAGYKDKDFNFANLRQSKEDIEKKLTELKQEIDQKVISAKKEILDSVLKDHYNETIESLVGDDAEMKKKIEFHYARLQDIAGTKSEVSKKLLDAWTLATKPEENNALNSTVISSGGVSRPNIKTQEKAFTPEEKQFAQKLASAGGITLKEEDFK